MYSLGRTILLPGAYEKIMAERAEQAERFGPGSELDPFVLEPLTVEVSRAGGGKTAGLLALYLLGAALFLRRRRV